MKGLVVDTSAVVAMVSSEPTAQWLTERLDEASLLVMGAPTAVELEIVLKARAGTLSASHTLRSLGVQIEPFGEDLFRSAASAWNRFGRGRHPARLNFGDCLTYAVADHTGYPILCTGNDFAQTDLPALCPPAEAAGSKADDRFSGDTTGP